MPIVPINAPRLVADLMALEPVLVRADHPLAEAAQLMAQYRVDGLPVVDPAGSLVGVISQTDLLRARATEYLWANWSGLRVKHLMTSPALTIHRDQPLTVAARKMERHRVHRLVVVADDDETVPIGVLSNSDLVRAMSAIPGADAPPGSLADDPAGTRDAEPPGPG
jgi:CBS domain-containing protein